MKSYAVPSTLTTGVPTLTGLRRSAAALVSGTTTRVCQVSTSGYVPCAAEDERDVP